MSGIRAAIFDMDGLLIDTEPIWRRAEIEVFGRLGLHLTEEQCLETMGVRLVDVVALWYGRRPWQGPSPAEVAREIEDAPNGVLSAKGAGMFCIAVPDPNFASDPRMQQADLVLPSLEQLTPSLIDKLAMPRDKLA